MNAEQGVGILTNTDQCYSLAGVPPVGVKFAHCESPIDLSNSLLRKPVLNGPLGYECSPTAGNAACSFENIVYPDGGSPFNVADGNAHCNSTNTTLPGGAPMISANISSTLSYTTSASAPAIYSTPSFHNGNAVYGGTGTALMTTTVTRHSTSGIGDAGPTSVTIVPGSGGYNGSGATAGVASATVTSFASSSPIETFQGGASKDGGPYALAGAVASIVAIVAALL